MATPRRPYASLRLGTLEDALGAGVSGASVLVLALLLTHRSKRSVPGLVQLGPAGLAESVRMPLGTIKKALNELETAGLVLVDLAARLIYAVGAVDDDAPKTENAVRGMAAQLRELPESIITDVVRRTVTAALSTAGSAWLPLWTELSRPDVRPAPDPDSERNAGPDANPGPDPDSCPLRSRSQDPRSDPEIRSRDPGSAHRRNGHGRSPAARERVDAGFEKFWEAYPKKVGKDAALKAWQKRRPSADVQAQMLAALQWQRQQDAWLRDDGRYTPNPASWLNAGRWMDEPTNTPRLSDSTLAIARAGEEFLKS